MQISTGETKSKPIDANFSTKQSSFSLSSFYTKQIGLFVFETLILIFNLGKFKIFSFLFFTTPTIKFLVSFVMLFNPKSGSC